MWYFETSKPLPLTPSDSNTPPPTRPHLLILPQQFHQLGPSIPIREFTEVVSFKPPQPGKRLTVHRTGHLNYLILSSSLAVVPFWRTLTYNTSIVTSFIHLGRSIHILLQMSFLPIFWSCSSQVPDHPTNLLLTAHESVNNCTYGHFFFQIKCVLLNFCPLWRFPRKEL